MNADEFLMQGGVASAKFPVIGTTVTGTIAREPEVRDQTDFDTGKVKTWDDGTPRRQLMVVLQTAERDPANPDDDGERAVYVKGQMKTAVRDAVRKAGAPGLKVGGTLTVQYIADGQATRGNPPKQYAASYVPPANAAANDFLNGGEPQAVPAQPVPQAVPAFVPQAPAPQPMPAPAPAPQPVPQAAPTAPPVQQAAPALSPEMLAAIANLPAEEKARLGLA
ncbi:hypothetical protein [Actinomadura montaniterrae]|uniref:Uncharacterized protein n=1 Tax=Actinomadura montaniterrae TaxID=1803903 RepID=A0A6L3W593_9ACTN|nr:hypothetical protein [Actinomadura montaniterrae]KAB2384734.1 hypothetical protein F9B16_09815 [Actinomadura montaniterrae]